MIKSNQDCKCGEEMMELATDSRIPGTHNSRKLKAPFTGTVWWCRECGKVCVKGELIGETTETIDPIWFVPNREEKLRMV